MYLRKQAPLSTAVWHMYAWGTTDGRAAVGPGYTRGYRTEEIY